MRRRPLLSDSFAELLFLGFASLWQTYVRWLTDLRVQVELSNSIDSLCDLEAFPITLASGGQVALSSVANF